MAGHTPFVDRGGEDIEAQGMGQLRECFLRLKLDLLSSSRVGRDADDVYCQVLYECRNSKI